jgi:DNA primase
MARYTSDSRDRVREAVDMVDLVSARTELRRAGANRYEGLCPFHDERTPSFGINPAEKVYYCFGCQASGDAFTFVQETEGVPFREALELLADRYGIELEREQEDPRAAERRRRRERLLSLLERTAGYYVRCLWETPEAGPAREYLEGRGLTEETLRAFRVGYAPSAWDRVLLASRRAGFSEEELLATGLAQRSRTRAGSLYDRFRERIMFPLSDARGRVLGFGARSLRENQKPKYLNSPEGELYHKGRQVFGADLARAEAARAGAVIAVEGYTDVLALHQAGLANAVAIMGTALTEEQVAELSRLAPAILLALDADRAGQEAMVRAARVAEGRRLELRVVPMPMGTDPADLIADRGAEAMRELVGQAVPFVRFAVERAVALGDLSSAEGRDRVLEEVRPAIASLPPSAMREELTRVVADRLDLSPALTESLLRGPAGGSPSAGPGARALDRRERTERTFLALCLAMPEDGRRLLERAEPERHFTSPVVRRAATHLRAQLHSPLAGLPPDDEPLAALIAELAVRASREPAAPATLRVEWLQLEKARLEREMNAARAAGGEGLADLVREKQQVVEGIRSAFS